MIWPLPWGTLTFQTVLCKSMVVLSSQWDLLWSIISDGYSVTFSRPCECRTFYTKYKHMQHQKKKDEARPLWVLKAWAGRKIRGPNWCDFAQVGASHHRPAWVLKVWTGKKTPRPAWQLAAPGWEGAIMMRKDTEEWSRCCGNRQS